ncbi:MAG: beta-ketoacyl-ACP synthase III [Pseudomonadota bacterium]
MIRAALRGVGSALPKRVVTNQDLEKTVDTTDAWIVERTGIKQRHIAGDGETTVSLGSEAARKALVDAGMDASEIDLIIVATATPDATFPASAALIQRELGIRTGTAFDVAAVCSGFLYALTVASSLMETGQQKKALVIGSETFSRIIDWTDRRTCVLFGDGAGAFVLEAEEGDTGILSSTTHCDGSLSHILYVDGGPSGTGTVGHLRMDGPKVFKEAIARISGAVETCAEKVGIAVPDIDWFVPHQANQRILQGVAKRLKLNEDQVVSTVAEHANTSAASIPLAFDKAWKDGRICKGDLCMLEGMGGGLTWGAVLIKV